MRITKDATESPLEMLLTLTFKEHKRKTEMTVHHKGIRLTLTPKEPTKDGISRLTSWLKA